MSIASAAPSQHSPAPGAVDEPVASTPRVRHQARDAATLMAFSASVSVGMAVLFLLLAVAARQA